MSTADKNHQPTEAVTYVGFWIRFMAFIVDNIVGAILTLPMVKYITLDLTQISNPVYMQALQTKMYLSLGLFFIIILLCWRYLNATPGKLLFKAHIVDANNFKPASNRQLFVRAIAYIPSCIFALGFICIGLDKKKQGWHDKLANTVVIFGQKGPLTSE